MWKMSVFLSIIWAVNLLYGEWFAFLIPSLSTCSWPHLQPSSSSSSSQLNEVENGSDYVKIAVVADPQLMDKTSLPLAPKSLALEIVQFYTDLYMRRAFVSSVLAFNPDVVLFLGDYFDGGYILSDQEWEESLGRFKHIFNLNILRKNSNIKLYYISGNHDIGYENVNSRNPEIVKRHEREFGGSNFKVTLGKVDFIAIDSQTLDGHPQGKLTSETWDFVKNASQDIYSNPRVLLTHIPLYRPDFTPCGPHRSSPIVNQRIYRDGQNQEIWYQNYVTKNSTEVLLDLVRPALILSGHDHDQCTVTHMSKNVPVTEQTVGTISWQQGNLYPSFMLISATNNSTTTPQDAISTQLCFLPMQTHIYLWYLSLFVMTLITVLVWPANEVVISRKLGNIMGNIKNIYSSFRSAIKEKNEDENCEYEEIWDAEGSMHLIKKAKKVSSTFVNESTSIERGNAVMRSKVRKQAGPEGDASTNPDVSIYVGSVRANRSRGKMVIWRLLRGLRAIIVVAAINVPLYVLLVFKDWIDK
ncbi:PREDICTED: uncharacterized protein C630.12 isoform X1 [Erythranthe guttata]|uniref:uncharacterized protein C630.12 isoform X1 n=1 Tax=Erythranthe guttata TaxID=4155 RepID=UPI00064DF81A|nr:PREDICTED: uncharacterized protein C630.12 isoform X1 [Erythranthe guttata]|eukprot:XP_012833186.1 PREDICTED: uncharacterized protein C630.12 isoform X1 [Erythranthe guttata]